MFTCILERHILLPARAARWRPRSPDVEPAGWITPVSNRGYPISGGLLALLLSSSIDTLHPRRRPPGSVLAISSGLAMKAATVK